MIYNGVDLKQYFRISRITKGWLPPHLLNLISIPRRAGAWFAGKKRGIRVIKIDITITAKDTDEIHQKIDELVSVLDTDEPKRLILTEQPNRHWMATLDGGTDEDRRGLFLMKNQLTFICPDPHAYSIDKDIFKLGQDQVINQGTAPATPLIIADFIGPATEYKITHVQTGKMIRVIRNFVAGDVLVIDCNTYKVMVNGVLAMPDLDLNSDLETFDLPVGVNTFNITGSNTTEIEYHKRWL